MASSSCGPNLWRITGVIKKSACENSSPLSKAVKSFGAVGAGDGGYSATVRSVHSNHTSRGGSSSKALAFRRESAAVPSCQNGGIQSKDHRNASSFYEGKAGMSSWLRSSSVLFIKGSSGNGSGGDGVDPPGKSPRRSRSNKELGETSILRQDGHNFEEVPAAVLKSDSSEKPRKGPPRTYVELDPNEETAFIEGFSNFNTPQQVLKMLDTIPCQEVTPIVAFSILKKLFELENNFGFRNEGQSWLNVSENGTTETFARLAIVTRLIDTILTCENNEILLDTLDLLRRECPHVNDQTYGLYDPDNHLDYRNKLLHELLVRVTEGKLGLEQVCRAVIILGKMEIDKGFSFNKDFIDKFWVGIVDRSEDINSENIVDVLRTVRYFKKSSRLVLNLVERKMIVLWWKMDTKTVAEVCSIFTSDDGPILSVAAKSLQGINTWQVSARLLMTLSKCTNLNIHKVREGELSKIVKAFHTLNFCDTAIEQALNKYMKAKCLKISDPQLVSNIAEYARKFRLRSSILEAAAEFVVRHEATNLSPPQFANIVRPFGELDYHPPQGVKFWEIAESFLNEKFIQFPPNDIIEVFLACVYLKKYPINFVDKIFSPYFLDRLHTSESDLLQLQQHRSNLKLLDMAMTIDCKSKYARPLLPKDFSSKTMFIDGRILRISNVLKEALLNINPDSSTDTSLILPNLPLNTIFTADLLITTPKIESESERHSFIRSFINSSLLYTAPPVATKTYDLTIILVNIPEHFSSDGKHLVGIQSMRRRLLKALGFRVANLQLQKLIDAKGDFDVLTEYVQKKLKESC